MVFTVGNGVLSLYDTVLIVLLPIWVIEHTSVPVALVPVLMAVNTVLTVLLQVYVARFAEGTAAAIRLLMLTGALMAFCCGVFAVGQMAGHRSAVCRYWLRSWCFRSPRTSSRSPPGNCRPNCPRSRLRPLSGRVQPRFQRPEGHRPQPAGRRPAADRPAGVARAGRAFGAAALVSRTAAHRCLAERARARNITPAIRS